MGLMMLFVAGARHTTAIQDNCILDTLDLPQEAESSDEEAADARRRSAKAKTSNEIVKKDPNAHAINLMTRASGEAAAGKPLAGAKKDLGERAGSVPNPYADTIAALSNPFDGLSSPSRMPGVQGFSSAQVKESQPQKGPDIVEGAQRPGKGFAHSNILVQTLVQGCTILEGSCSSGTQIQ